MPITTVHPNCAASNPLKGRSLKRITGGVDKAVAATAAADVVGIAYNPKASDGSVRGVDVGEIWFVELEAGASNVTTVGVQMMVTANGHKAKAGGDTGLCIGTSVAPPIGVPPTYNSITFSAKDADNVMRKWVWIQIAPVTVT